MAIGDFGASGTATITGSTFTGNNASDEGGAIDNGFYSSLDGHTGHATLVVSGTAVCSALATPFSKVRPRECAWAGPLWGWRQDAMGELKAEENGGGLRRKPQTWAF